MAKRSTSFTALQERTLLNIANGMKDGDAGIAAGYSENNAHVTVSKLLARPEAQARLEELRNKVADRVIKRVEITKDKVMDEVWDTYEEARKNKRAGDALKALELIGKEKGMFANTNRNIEVSNWAEGLPLKVLQMITDDPEPFLFLMNNPEAYQDFVAQFDRGAGNDNNDNAELGEPDYKQRRAM